VVLVGPPGSGKSTWAASAFADHQVVSSDRLRALVGEGEHDQRASKDAFDVLYAEGDEAPKMMSVGLHCRLAGRPGRAAGLIRFLDYIGQHERVWVPTRLQIARHWHDKHAHLAADAFEIG